MSAPATSTRPTSAPSPAAPRPGVALGTALVAVAALVLGACSSSSPDGSAPETSTSVPGTAGGPSAPVGGPVPGGFAPASVAFVSAAQGFVLGTAPCSASPCTSIVATDDGGQTWRGIPAPRTPLLDPSAPVDGSVPGVSRLRFGSPTDGWAFGPDLWSTHDGGATWNQQTLGGTVTDLASADGATYAIVSHCGGVPCPQGATLYRSNPGGDAWAPVEGVALPSTGGRIALQGASVWVAPNTGTTGEALMAISPDGRSWSSAPVPCPSRDALVDLTATSSSDVLMLCAGDAGAGSEEKVVVRSVDGGRTATGLSQAPPTEGIGTAIAATGDQVVALAARSGASYVYRTGDGGASWTAPLTTADGGAGFVDLGFTTADQGVVVQGPPGTPAAALLMTHDAGLTWQEVALG